MKTTQLGNNEDKRSKVGKVLLSQGNMKEVVANQKGIMIFRLGNIERNTNDETKS